MPGTAVTHSEALQRFVDEYFKETNQERATAKEIAVWLIQTGRWEPPHDLLLRQCREEVGDALRREYISDEFGRPVRAKHVARIVNAGTQRHLWADIRNMSTPREHWEASFQQRREQIVGDCRQLNYDVDYFNSTRSHDEPIQLVFDFRDDIEEAGFSGTYPPKKPR